MISTRRATENAARSKVAAAAERALPTRRAKQGDNVVRVIGGSWRRRLIRFPASAQLRPTPDRVRETLFNWLGQELPGLRCLDLYAGSGALGFEAASRGAAEVVLVEQDFATVSALKATAALLNARQVTIVRGDALEFLNVERSTFDVVFVDPPFAQGISSNLMRAIAARMTQGGRIYVEAGEPFRPPPGFRLLKQARAGNVHYQLLCLE